MYDALCMLALPLSPLSFSLGFRVQVDEASKAAAIENGEADRTIAPLFELAPAFQQNTSNPLLAAARTMLLNLYIFMIS